MLIHIMIIYLVNNVINVRYSLFSTNKFLPYTLTCLVNYELEVFICPVNGKHDRLLAFYFKELQFFPQNSSEILRSQHLINSERIQPKFELSDELLSWLHSGQTCLLWNNHRIVSLKLFYNIHNPSTNSYNWLFI